MGEWEWKIGFLHALGACAWQECGGRMRRITHVLTGPQGQIGFGKSVLHLLQNNLEEIPHLDLVVHGVPVDEAPAKDLERLWNGNLIQPVNGHPRIKLT